ncbi:MULTISPECIES: hypothetical protein [Bradyrhizobium]|uniref:IS66 family transposase n=1 Tax=Bradyrhizobium sp. Mp19 TaxID=3042156 RepID=UPI002225F879|nr:MULTISPECIES: hypothetical protein [Bradyrhizobium]MCW2357488.1 hypothetical protein [Bradyrhizobium elkanii]MDI2054652.1 transposase [Bradyrhizobium sp. Mp19]
MSDLPSDPALLRQAVMALSSRLAALSAECGTLAAERDAAIAQRDAAVQENDKLQIILSQYKRTIFGPRSETLDPGQLPLFAITAQAAGPTTTLPEAGCLTERRAVESDRRDATGGSFRSICRASTS